MFVCWRGLSDDERNITLFGKRRDDRRSDVLHYTTSMESRVRWVGWLKAGARRFTCDHRKMGKGGVGNLWKSSVRFSFLRKVGAKIVIWVGVEMFWGERSYAILIQKSGWVNQLYHVPCIYCTMIAGQHKGTLEIHGLDCKVGPANMAMFLFQWLSAVQNRWKCLCIQGCGYAR